MIRMYNQDEELQELRQERWDKDKILSSLIDLYKNNKPIHKSALPEKLRFIILKTVPPQAPEHRQFFESFTMHSVKQLCKLDFNETKMDC